MHADSTISSVKAGSSFRKQGCHSASAFHETQEGFLLIGNLASMAQSCAIAYLTNLDQLYNGYGKLKRDLHEDIAFRYILINVFELALDSDMWLLCTSSNVNSLFLGCC